MSQVDAASRAALFDQSARHGAAELASARGRMSKLEASLAAREQEAQRLQRLLAAAEAQAEAQVCVYVCVDIRLGCAAMNEGCRRWGGDGGGVRARA